MSGKWVMDEQHKAVLRLALMAGDKKRAFIPRWGFETNACHDLLERDVMVTGLLGWAGVGGFRLTRAGVKIAEQASIDCERCKSAYMDYVCKCCGRGMCDECFPSSSGCPVCKTERS